MALRTPAGKAVSGDLFVPPPGFAASDVLVTDRMTIGTSKTVTVGTAGKVGLVVFDGVAEQRISLKLSSVSVTAAYVSIQRPDGSRLVWPTVVGPGGAFIDTVTLPATGTYTILVDPDSSYTGNMTLTLYDVPPDTTGTITVGGAAQTVTLETPGQNGTLTFSGTQNQRVSLRLSPVSVAAAYVSIRKPDGSDLVGRSVVGPGGLFVDTRTLPSTGTYTIVLDPDGASTGNATMTLYDVPADTTGTITPGGSAQTVSLSTPGQNGSLTFAGTADARFSLRLSSVSIGAGYVSVRKPDGSNLVGPSVFGQGGLFTGSHTLPATGTYTIVLDPDGASTGSATVTLYDVPADASGTLTIDGPSRTITAAPGQNPYVSFEGAAGAAGTPRGHEHRHRDQPARGAKARRQPPRLARLRLLVPGVSYVRHDAARRGHVHDLARPLRGPLRFDDVGADGSRRRRDGPAGRDGRLVERFAPRSGLGPLEALAAGS